MIRILKQIMILLFFLFVPKISAQDSVLHLSLHEAQTMAIKHNRAVQNASIDVRKAEAARWQTIATMLPQVMAGYNYQNTLGFKTEFRIPTGTNPGTGEQTYSTISRENPPQGIFDITAGVQISGQQLVGTLINNVAADMADITQKQTIQNIQSQVTQLYMSALAMEKTILLLDSNSANIDKIYKMTQNAVLSGVAEKISADKIYIQVLNIKNVLNSSKQNLEVVFNTLKLLLSVDIGSKIVLTDNIDQLTDAQDILTLLYVEFDPRQNYNYQLLQKNKEVAKKQISLAAMGYFPSLTFAYRFSNVKYFGGEPMMNMNPPHVLTFGLKLPLFTSGKVLGSVVEKKMSYQQIVNNITDAEQNLLMQEQQLKYDLSSAYRSFEIQRQNSEVSQRVFENTSEKYEYGKASSFEVTQASSDMISAQNSYIQALVNMINTQIALKKLLNRQ